MNVPWEPMIVQEMEEFVKILQIYTLAVAQSIIWMYPSIASNVLDANANDVSILD